MMMARAID
jgi:hypothetical protein